jgi:outer membrane protein assembly factor BamB
MSAKRLRDLLVLLLLASSLQRASGAALSGQTRLLASPEAGWPQWRGPRRDGISDEVGLLQSWPLGGPRLLWQTKSIGNGYSAPILSSGRIFITGETDDDLWITALDLEGRTLWRTKNGRAWKGPFPGARASCTYSEGRLYHMNSHGRVACLDPRTGQALWAFDMFERFGGKNPTWAVSENLLVDGPRLVLTPGGTKALMAAVDKKNGSTLWSSEPLRLGTPRTSAHERLEESPGAIDNCGYGSPILFRLGDQRLIVNSSLRHAFGVDADSGRLLWTRSLPTRYSVIAATPVLIDQSVLITAPDTPAGSKLFRLEAEATSVRVETEWVTRLDTCHGAVVYVNGALFGSWYRHRKGWACIDRATGAVRYETDQLAQGSILYADQRLYCLSQEGEMALVKPGAAAFEFSGRFRIVPEGKEDVWAHPVVLDGRLYLRYHDALFCYDLRANSNPF